MCFKPSGASPLGTSLAKPIIGLNTSGKTRKLEQRCIYFLPFVICVQLFARWFVFDRHRVRQTLQLNLLESTRLTSMSRLNYLQLVIAKFRYTRISPRPRAPPMITLTRIYLSRSKQSSTQFSCTRALGIRFTPVSRVIARANVGVSNCHSMCSTPEDLRTSNSPLAMLACSFSAMVKVTILLSTTSCDGSGSDGLKNIQSLLRWLSNDTERSS